MSSSTSLSVLTQAWWMAAPENREMVSLEIRHTMG